ncbi:MAG: hypothetical protein QG589_357 [Patescibacteria group bacterium]|nr:hypothetical protein [Patescibacteria group bacterium]
MIYLLYGTDVHKSRAKLHEMLRALVKKRPNAELFKITTENWNEGQFIELLGSQGLFDQKYIVVLDGLLGKKETKNLILEKLSDMQNTEHPFLMVEGKIDAPTIKKIEKIAEKIQEFVKSEQTKETYNIFSVTEGLLARDKKRLWVSYIDLLRRGGVPEEIHGILFWQVKNMLLASRADSQTDTGLTPYQYKNALAGARKYTTDELVSLMSSLVNITHSVRSGEGDIDILTEKWILGV